MDNFSRIAQEVLLAYFIPGFLLILTLLFAFDSFTEIDVISRIKDIKPSILITLLLIFSQVMGFFLDTLGHLLEGIWYKKVKDETYFKEENGVDNRLKQEIDKDPIFSDDSDYDKRLLVESLFAKCAKDRVYYRRNWEFCYYEAGRNIAIVWGAFVILGAIAVSKRFNIPYRCFEPYVITLLLLYIPLILFMFQSLKKYFNFHTRAAREYFIVKNQETANP